MPLLAQSLYGQQLLQDYLEKTATNTYRIIQIKNITISKHLLAIRYEQITQFVRIYKAKKIRYRTQKEKES